MPELPDVVVYVEALQRLLGGRRLESLQVRSPFLVRTFEPDLDRFVGRTVRSFQRLGKLIVWQFDGDLYLVIHLMIAGRYHWRKPGALPRGKNDLAALGFEHGVMMLTEASKKKRAALYAVEGADGLDAYRRDALEVLDCSLAEFRTALTHRNHTLKRALTSPQIFSGIGNAYSDEILHAARLSPLRWTQKLADVEIERLFAAVQITLRDWVDRLREETGEMFPEKVTAFRPQMAVHGRFQQPCPVCQTPVQRIVYAEKETNYCPRCQTDGKLLADRSLSRLLKDDWPKTIDQWEQ